MTAPSRLVRSVERRRLLLGGGAGALALLALGSIQFWFVIPQSRAVVLAAGTSRQPDTAARPIKIDEAAESSPGVVSQPAVVSPPASGPPRGGASQAELQPQPPGFVPWEQPRVAAGIELPDGTFLPPLNGVSVGDPIPRVEREAHMPAIGDVVGRLVDREGYAWWVTSDGSAFTTRWMTLRLADGTIRKMVRLDQSDSLSDERFAHSLKPRSQPSVPSSPR